MKWIRVLSALGVFVCFALWVDQALASRNASGTMSGINGPYTAGSVISSSVINARFSDIETEMTDSLNRSGKGGMLAALRGTDGTVTAPAFAFTSETGTGLYRIGTSNPGFAVNQAKVGEWTANGYLSANGAVATPSLAFSNDTGSGLYRIGSNNIGFAINGSKRQEWTTTGSIVTGTLNATGATTFSTTLGVTGATTLSSGSTALVENGTTLSGFAGFWSGTAAASPSTSNYFLAADGSSNTTINSPTTLNLDVAGTVIASMTSSGLKIGSGGTTTAQLNFGSCTTNAGTPSVCTATVATGAKCVANIVGTSASTDSVTNSVTSTTLTITIQNGVAKTVNYICF